MTTRRTLLEALVAQTVLVPLIGVAAPVAPLAVRPARAGEFRGVWIQTILQEKRFVGKSSRQVEAYLTRLVDLLHRTGFNALIFQVRAEGDAFYASRYEPWSRRLTGREGQAPDGGFDPLRVLIRLCHERKMEFHAWINPYRMGRAGDAAFAPTHLYRRHPEWFVTYAGKLYLDPGRPESRSWIRSVVRDIVSRYPVDAIHMDDYFYPYPVKGVAFNDGRTFAAQAAKLGIDRRQPGALGRFRRQSVSLLIQGVHADIAATRPGVRFGVSPFGIYRNRASWAEGSATNGIQCYDDLYADVLLWARQGWIDYLAPQLYWEIGHPQADYARLCTWWAAHVPARCKLYIGQSLDRSRDGSADFLASGRMLTKKINQARENPRIGGMCVWYGYQVEENDRKCRDFLRLRAFRQG